MKDGDNAVAADEDNHNSRRPLLRHHHCFRALNYMTVITITATTILSLYDYDG
jgi:hypothetical protein